MRVAVADIGTNSCHMLVAEIDLERGAYRVLDSLKERTRLGEALKAGEITTKGALRVEQTLRRFRALAERYRVVEFVLSATSAVREAKNGPALVTRWRDATGLQVEVISGEREAELTYLGVVGSLELGSDNLLLDLGGGSLEFALGDAQSTQWVHSVPLGVVRLQREFLQHDPPTVGERKRLERYVRTETALVRERLEPILAERGVQISELRVLGSSGTFVNIARMIAMRQGHEVRTVGGVVVTRLELERMCTELLILPLEKRLKVLGLEEKRADIMPAGALITLAVLETLGVDEFMVSESALREGMLAEFVMREAERVSHLSPRAAGVFALLDRFDPDHRHARHVAQLADLLFNALAPFWGLGDSARELLRAGAMLHEIGYVVNPSGHHKHAQYLILNAGLRGFEPWEQEIVALLARYHRKGPPKGSHPEFARLSRERQQLVRRLAAILRLADGLDRGHAARVFTLQLHLEPQAVLEVGGTGNLELELWGAEAKADLLNEELGRPLSIVRAQAEVGDADSALPLTMGNDQQ